MLIAQQCNYFDYLVHELPLGLLLNEDDFNRFGLLGACEHKIEKFRLLCEMIENENLTSVFSKFISRLSKALYSYADYASKRDQFIDYDDYFAKRKEK